MILTTRPRLPATVLTLLASGFLAIAYNLHFWRSLLAAFGPFSLGRLPLYAASVIAVVLLLNACLTLLSFRPLLKPLLTILFIASAGTSFFVSEYGTAIDRTMIQSMVETDVHEAVELLSLKLVATVALLGLLPSLLLWRTDLRYAAGMRGLGLRTGIAAACLLAVLVVLALFFKTLAPVLREHRNLRYLLAPSNVVQAIHAYAKSRHALQRVVAPLGTDAVKGVARSSNRLRAVTVIVVGETARAANFSLNGYARDTNPELARQAGLLNFSHVQSCGTATAVSVPCVFSALGRARYSDSAAYSQQGLLDVLSHAGYSVLWRDNNSGCKGACDRVAYEDLSQPLAGNRWCVDGECYDERLLERLPEMIASAAGDMVIVLHQKGSHGPAYAKRYPPAFARFGPACTDSVLANCSREAIVAAYDNSILYTDHFLSKTIDLLRASAEREHLNTALLYFSDHGESLGEHNLYLHGAPYLIAPAEQREVPMMLWLSAGFRERFGIDQRCLAARTHTAFSHDNVFHSVLGMLNVNTTVYNPRLDLFSPCLRSL